MLPYTDGFDFSAPDNIVFGCGVVDQIGERINEIGTDIFLVTDPGIRQAGLVEPVLKSLEDAALNVDVYDEVEPDPKTSTVKACLERAGEEDPDVLVGIGGGSVMDVAKVTSVLLANDHPVQEIYGRPDYLNESLPSILLPTTAGTGSEVSPGVVLIDDDSGEKEAIISDTVFAHTALVDPDLSMDLPPSVTRASGFDAFSHAIGSYMSTTTNTFAKALCTEAMQLIETHLREATYHGGTAPEARKKMSLAATMAMLGRVNGGKSAIHSVAYGLQGMYDVPHGEAIAMILPEVIDYNLPAVTDSLAQLGEQLYAAEGSTRTRAEIFVEGVCKLRGDVDLDRSLRSIGATEDDMDRLAEMAVHSDRHLETNPRRITKDDARAILERIW